MKTIDTERLVLRPFRWEDFDDFHQLAYADPAVAPWWTGCTKTPEEVKGAFRRTVEQPIGQPGWLAVILKDGDALIGGIGLQRWTADEDTSWYIPEHPADAPKRDPEVLEVELTYVLGRAYWGHGYATEAAEAVLAYGFGELGVTRMLSPINSENDRSIRLARRVGCRIARNLHPRPSPHQASPGVIAVLESAVWLKRMTGR